MTKPFISSPAEGYGWVVLHVVHIMALGQDL
jgi:hypothetical protein